MSISNNARVSITLQTNRGRIFSLRRVTPSDVPLLSELLGQVSAQTRWLRYATRRPLAAEWVAQEATRMSRGYRWPHVALIATIATNFAGIESHEAIAIAELIVNSTKGETAEIAFLVRDDFQNDGIGTQLARWLTEIAELTGLTTIHANILAENISMQRLMRRIGSPGRTRLSRGELEMSADLPALAHVGDS